MHQVSIGVISGENFGGWFEIGFQLLRTGKLFERQGKEGCIFSGILGSWGRDARGIQGPWRGW